MLVQIRKIESSLGSASLALFDCSASKRAYGMEAVRAVESSRTNLLVAHDH